MTTEMMNRVELNNNELEMVNGAGLLTWRVPNFPMDDFFRRKESPKRNYKLPEMDVDNRPPITPPVFCPTSKQA